MCPTSSGGCVNVKGKCIIDKQAGSQRIGTKTTLDAFGSASVNCTS